MNNRSRWCVSEESVVITGVGTGKEGGQLLRLGCPDSLLNLCFSSSLNLVNVYPFLCPGLNATVPELLRTRFCSIAQLPL